MSIVWLLVTDMNTKPEKKLLGYVVKVKKDMHGSNDISIAQLTNMEVDFYVGYDNRRFLRMPTNSSVLYNTRKLALRSRRELLKKEPNLIAVVIPVYKQPVPDTSLVVDSKQEIDISDVIKNTMSKNGKLRKLTTKPKRLKP